MTGECTPRSRTLKARQLAHLPNHCKNTDSCVSCVKAIRRLAHATVVLRKRGSNISRHPVGITKLVCPEPGKLISPLAERVEDIASGILESIAHGQESFSGRFCPSLESTTIIVLEIVYGP